MVLSHGHCPSPFREDVPKSYFVVFIFILTIFKMFQKYAMFSSLSMYILAIFEISWRNKMFFNPDSHEMSMGIEY